MKKLSFYTTLGLSFIMISTTSCSSNSSDNKSTPSTVDVTPIVNMAEQGTWKVTKYTDHGDDKLSNFAGYNFTFSPNGVLTATNATTSKTHTGEWSVTTTAIAPWQSVADQSPSDPVDFNIHFPDSESSNFTDINDDWDRVSMSDTKMEFIDVSATPGKVPDYITFEKN